MRVVEVKVKGCNGSTCYDYKDTVHILEELGELLNPVHDEDHLVITVTVGEMDEAVFKNLGDFEGY